MLKRIVLAGLAVIILTPLLLLVAADRRRAQLDSVVQDEWANRSVYAINELESVRTLEILPIVNWHTDRADLITEPGVSYLVKSEQWTILFDLGLNMLGTAPSPLEHNLSALGVDMSSIDTVFLSHAHRDHVGGVEWEVNRTFSTGLVQGQLAGKRVVVPIDLEHPTAEVEVVSNPEILGAGYATTGPIRRQLFVGSIDEQALVINLAGKGLVLVVGCGHQTLPKLVARVEETFDEPIYAIVGDLHYPVPKGRLYVRGIDAQRRLASGEGLFAPISMEDVEADLRMIEDRAIGYVALGGHDTSNEVLDLFDTRLADRFEHVKAGSLILLN